MRHCLTSMICCLLSGVGFAHADMSTSDLRVQLQAVQEARINSGLTGTLKNLPVKDGQVIETGDTLLTFDCQRQQAEASRAKAKLDKYNKIVGTNERLNELGSVSALDVQISQKERDEASADYAVTRASNKACVIKAPFGGRITEVMVKAHQHVQEAEPLFEIVDDSQLELQVIVPSKWLRWIKVGNEFSIRIDETDQTYVASVTRIGGKVDPVTQSVKLYGLLKEPAQELRAGMSGTALIQPPRSKDKNVHASSTAISK